MNHLKLTPSTLVNPKVETLTDFLKYFVNKINGTEIMQILVKLYTGWRFLNENFSKLPMYTYCQIQ